MAHSHLLADLSRNHTFLKRKSQSHCHIQHHLGANPNKTLRLRSKIMLRASSRYVSTRFLADASRFSPKPSPKAPPNVSAIAPYRGRLRTHGRWRSLRQRIANKSLHPQTPRVKREPFAMHSGKIWPPPPNNEKHSALSDLASEEAARRQALRQSLCQAAWQAEPFFLSLSLSLSLSLLLFTTYTLTYIYIYIHILFPERCEGLFCRHPLR